MGGADTVVGSLVGIFVPGNGDDNGVGGRDGSTIDCSGVGLAVGRTGLLGLDVGNGIELLGLDVNAGAPVVGGGEGSAPEGAGVILGNCVSARQRGESFAFGRQSTIQSSPPWKHIDPGCSTLNLPGPSVASVPLQIWLTSSST
jgi:hypothetical protein